MQVIHPRCAGLDVHKKSVTACILLTAANGQVTQHKNSFGTTTEEIFKLLDWLKHYEVSDAAMESTGEFWKPIYNLLEGQIQMALVNAQHAKALPGRKTDQSDAEWLADLHRHGLLRASYVPQRPQRELRELVRHRTNLAQRRAQVINHLHKVLESTNIKLTSVVTDITGVSATQMLQELLAGQTDPELLAELGRGPLRKKKEQLRAALRGELRAHHKLILSQLMADLEWCQEQASEVSVEIEKRLSKEQELIERLDEIPGVNRRIAEVIVAEVGSDVSHFPTDNHLVSWAGMCPGNDESAGKRRSGRLRGGNRSLRAAMVEAAQAGRRKKGSFFSARYARLAARRGKKRAVVAVGRTLLKAIWHMMNSGSRYQDLGVDYYERRHPEQRARGLARRIEHLGFKVTLERLTPAA